MEITSANYKTLNDRIKEDIVTVGQSAFGVEMTSEEIVDHILPTDRLYLGFTSEGKVSGFATAIIKDQSIYLSGAAVDPQYQQDGLYREFSSRRINLALQQQKYSVELRTQNPIIEATVSQILETLSTGGIIGGYSVKRERQLGTYGRMLTSAKPFSQNLELNTVYSQLDYLKGDSFLLEFKLR